MNGNFILVCIAIWILAIIGWIENIAKLLGAIHDPVTLLTILRIVGIFAAPFGSILGWFF